MKEWHRNSIMFLSVLLFVLFSLELAARLFIDPVSRVNYTPIPRSIMMQPTFPGVPYLLRPNGEGKQDFGSNPDGYLDKDSTLTYRINSLGFRGEETTKDKPPDTIRIVVIGDSFTFGSGVRNEDTLPSALESVLEGKHLKSNVEVLNLGSGRYNTVHEVNLLSHFGVTLDPDIVVIVFFLNDTNAGGTAKAFSSWVPKEQLPFWRRYSQIADLIASRFDRQRAAQELVKNYKASYKEDSLGWMRCRKALKRAKSLSEKQGFELILAIYPVLWSLSDNYPFLEIHETISDYAISIGIPATDFLPAFNGHDGPELWAHPNNQHPNARAHLIAANAMSEFLTTTYPVLLE